MLESIEIEKNKILLYNYMRKLGCEEKYKHNFGVLETGKTLFNECNLTLSTKLQNTLLFYNLGHKLVKEPQSKQYRFTRRKKSKKPTKQLTPLTRATQVLEELQIPQETVYLEAIANQGKAFNGGGNPTLEMQVTHLLNICNMLTSHSGHSCTLAERYIELEKHSSDEVYIKYVRDRFYYLSQLMDVDNLLKSIHQLEQNTERDDLACSTLNGTIQSIQ